MQIETIPIESLVSDPANARVHGERNKRALRASLAAHGQVEPLIVQSGTMKVVAGNGRLECMKELGFKTVQCVLLKLSDTQAVSLAIALNRTAELATWDEHVLKNLLDSLPEESIDGTGFEPLEIEALGSWSGDIENPKDIEDYDKDKDTFFIKVENIKAEDKDDVLDYVRRAVAGFDGVKANVY